MDTTQSSQPEPTETTMDLQSMHQLMLTMKKEIMDLKLENKNLRECLDRQTADFNNKYFIQENSQIESAQKALIQKRAKNPEVISEVHHSPKGGTKRHLEKTGETPPPPPKKKNDECNNDEAIPTRKNTAVSKPPPIIISQNNQSELIRIMTETYKYKNFLIKKSNKFRSSLQIEDMTFYKKMVGLLKERKYEFHTFTPKCDKPHTYLLKGMADGSTLAEVKEALAMETSKNVQIIKIERFKTRKSIKDKKDLPIFIVQISADSKIQDLLNISTVYYQKVHWEKINKTDLTQCRNCQRYGHVSSNCNMQYRCVKCNEQHAPGKCQLPKEAARSMLKCIMCGGAGHPSSFRGCPKAEEIKKKLQEKKNTTEERRNIKIQQIQTRINPTKTFESATSNKQTTTNPKPTPEPTNQESRLTRLEKNVQQIIEAIQQQNQNFVQLFSQLSNPR